MIGLRGGRRVSAAQGRIGWPWLLIPMIFILVGMFAAVFGIIELKQGYASSEWPTTEGRIAASQVRSKRSRSSDGDSRTTYHAEVWYTYTVDGRSYRSDRVSFGQYGSSDPSHAGGIVRRYPAQRKVQVFYDPSAPDIGVLEAGVSGGAWLLPGLGATFTFVGGLFLTLMVTALCKQRSKAPNPERQEV